MASDLKSILSLEVPIIVLLGARQLRTSEVMGLVPGAIIELPKKAEDELELLVNNKAIGTGVAVKVGENFGIKLSYVGDLKARVNALGSNESTNQATQDAAVEAMAEALLAGQV